MKNFINKNKNNRTINKHNNYKTNKKNKIIFRSNNNIIKMKLIIMKKTKFLNLMKLNKIINNRTQNNNLKKMFKHGIMFKMQIFNLVIYRNAQIVSM